MENKKGVAVIIIVLFMMVCSVGVGLGAYFLSQQIKKSIPSSRSSGPIEEIEPTASVIPQESDSGTKLVSPTPEPQVSPSALVLTVNFTHSGTILDWDAQSESHTGLWRFLWDEPGALALNVELEFNPQSQCDLDQGYQVCDLQTLVNGTTVQLEGNREGDKVIVVKLQAI